MRFDKVQRIRKTPRESRSLRMKFKKVQLLKKPKRAVQPKETLDSSLHAFQMNNEYCDITILSSDGTCRCVTAIKPTDVNPKNIQNKFHFQQIECPSSCAGSENDRISTKTDFRKENSNNENHDGCRNIAIGCGLLLHKRIANGQRQPNVQNTGNCSGIWNR